MKIRFAKDEDYAAIARLHRQTIRNVNSKNYTGEQIRAWLARISANRFRKTASQCKRWVAIEDNKIVGFCDHGLDGEFWGLYVHKDYMGRGIGSCLIQTAEESLKKMGFKKVSLKATLTAREFYKRQGYKLLKQDLHSIDDQKLEIFHMTKTLF